MSRIAELTDIYEWLEERQEDLESKLEVMGEIGEIKSLEQIIKIKSQIECIEEIKEYIDSKMSFYDEAGGDYI